MYANILYERVDSGMDIDAITADLLNRDFYITVHNQKSNRSPEPTHVLNPHLILISTPTSASPQP